MPAVLIGCVPSKRGSIHRIVCNRGALKGDRKPSPMSKMWRSMSVADAVQYISHFHPDWMGGLEVIVCAGRRRHKDNFSHGITVAQIVATGRI